MKKLSTLIGLTLFILLLVAALSGCTIGALPVQAQEPHKPQKKAVIAVEKVVNGETIAGEVKLLFEDAPELPDAPPDAFGLFLEKAGETITLGSGAIKIESSVEIVNDQEPVTSLQAGYDGVEITFRFTEKTVFLRDTTEKPEITDEHMQAGEVIIPGTVESGAPFEISANMVLRAWGEYQDGVLVADLVVYEALE